MSTPQKTPRYADMRDANLVEVRKWAVHTVVTGFPSLLPHKKGVAESVRLAAILEDYILSGFLGDPDNRADGSFEQLSDIGLVDPLSSNHEGGNARDGFPLGCRDSEGNIADQCSNGIGGITHKTTPVSTSDTETIGAEPAGRASVPAGEGSL